MNMFARFDEIPVMTLQDIKKTKRYGRTDTNVIIVYPPQTKFAGGGGGGGIMMVRHAISQLLYIQLAMLIVDSEHA